VLEKAARLCERLGLDGRLSSCARLAALYHDVGRFPQYQRYRTFRDPDSVNHAKLGVATLKAQGPLKDIDAKSRSLIFAAIMVHNRKSVPGHLIERPEAPLTVVARIVRDADKLDILRVMMEHFSNKADDDVVTLGLDHSPGLYSEESADCLLRGATLSYAGMRYVNDMRILLASWVFDFNFEASKEAYFSMGAVDGLLGALPETSRVADMKARILRERPLGAGQDAR